MNVNIYNFLQKYFGTILFGIYLYSFLTVLLLAAETPEFLPRGINKDLTYLILSYVVNELINVDCSNWLLNWLITALKQKPTCSAWAFKKT